MNCLFFKCPKIEGPVRLKYWDDFFWRKKRELNKSNIFKLEVHFLQIFQQEPKNCQTKNIVKRQPLTIFHSSLFQGCVTTDYCLPFFFFGKAPRVAKPPWTFPIYFFYPGEKGRWISVCWCEQWKIPSYFLLYWMVNRDPYNGLL